MITRYLLVACLTVVGIVHCEATGGFDAAPPTSQYFSYYFKKLPRKAFIDIHGVPETKAEAPTEDEVIAAFDKPNDGLVSKMDEFISRARLVECANQLTPAPSNQGDAGSNANQNDTAANKSAITTNLGYRELSATDHALLNKLENLRDVAVAIQDGKVPADEVKSYVTWRLENDPSPTLDNFLAKASPKLQPSWLYLAGAGSFLAGKTDDALSKFEAALNHPQGKPFSEMALFMKARCLQSKVGISDDNTDMNQDDRQKGSAVALAAFKEYLNRYPKGRFVADAWGWIGGLEPDNIRALIDFYNEAASADHPETLVSASDEMERVVDNLDYEKDDHGFDELALHPDLALYMCYIAVGTSPLLSPDEDGDGTPASDDDEAKRRKEYLQNKEKWHTHFLQSLASAVLTHKDLYANTKGQAESVAILAHAASDKGDQTAALNLVQMAEQSGAMGDDLLFVKGVALQRSNNVPAALDCFNNLIQKYPKSDFVPGATYRKALALHDQGKNGEAMKILASLHGNNLETEDDDGNSQIAPELGVTDGEIFCTEDIISKFAPVESLLPPLSETDPAFADFRKALSNIVVARFLQKNDFKSAAQYEADSNRKSEFEARISEIEQTESNSTAAADKAKLASGLGDYWANNRGKLSGPDSLKEYPKIDTNDLSAAETLNFTQPDCKKIADTQDELVHATSWWEKVWHLDATSSQAPHALWKTLQAQRIFAEQAPDLGTPDDDAFAKDLYKNLTTHYPDSIEAQKYAVYWNLSGLPSNKQSDDERSIYTEKDLVYPQTSSPSTDDQGNQIDSKAPIPDFGDPRLTPWYDKIFSKGGGGAPEDGAAQNLQDEIEEVNHTPGIQPDVKKAFIAWLNQRASSNSDTPVPMPSTIPRDQVAEFCDSDDVLDNGMTPANYLAKYPKSLRREEVLYHVIHQCIYADKLDVPAAQTAFDDYLKEFPASHLRRGVLYMHGLFEEKQQNWLAACEDYCQVLEQMKAPELHKDAASHLAFIFDKMNEDELRKAILDDIQKNPDVRHWLRVYVQSGEMPYMKDYLLDHVKE